MRTGFAFAVLFPLVAVAQTDAPLTPTGPAIPSDVKQPDQHKPFDFRLHHPRQFCFSRGEWRKWKSFNRSGRGRDSN